MKIMTLFLISTFISLNAWAEPKQYQYQFDSIIDKSSDRLQAIIMDRESYCQNCRYSINGLQESIIIDRINQNKIYVFNDVNKMGSYPNFTVVEREDLSSNSTQISIKYADLKLANQLEDSTGRHHNQPFERLDTIWTLTELSPTKTKVHYHITIESDNPFVKFGWEQLKNETKTSAHSIVEMIANN